MSEPIVRLVLVQFEFFLSFTLARIRGIVRQFPRRVTPKVFANFSPGLSFGNPGLTNVIWWERATLKGWCPPRKPVAIPSGLRQNQSPVLSPGLPKLNPGLKLANTFGVTLRELEQRPKLKLHTVESHG